MCACLSVTCMCECMCVCEYLLFVYISSRSHARECGRLIRLVRWIFFYEADKTRLRTRRRECLASTSDLRTIRMAALLEASCFVWNRHFRLHESFVRPPRGVRGSIGTRQSTDNTQCRSVYILRIVRNLLRVIEAFLNVGYTIFITC